jgi:TIR domain
MSKSTDPVGHAFISYVREDAHHVDQLQRTLEAAGIPVWRDTADLWPGEDWRAKVKRAITDNALVFIACFSHMSLRRSMSYQNEELILAIEQLRLRSPDVPWLIPVRFDECDIPDRDIGGGRTLRSIQYADLFGDRIDERSARLAETILRMLARPTEPEDNHSRTSPLAQTSPLPRHAPWATEQIERLRSAEALELRSPLFFLSYALPPGAREGEAQTASMQRIVQFFNDLSDNVAQLTSRPVGWTPGYMPKFRGGSHWSDDLLEGLSTCQTFVPLLSAPYFSSIWCGMEWYAFSQRTIISVVDDRPGGQSAIIPVLWAPVSGEDIPAVVRSLQRFSPGNLPDASLNGIYQENGVAGLLHMRMDAAYHTLVWQLAKRIVQLADNIRVEPRRFLQSDLHNVFWRP